MWRVSLLHSTNIYYVLLCGMNRAWECRSGQDRPGFCLQQPWSPETHSPIMTEKKRCTSLRRYRWGQGVGGDVPEVQEGVWSLRDGCGNTKCGAGGWRALQAEGGQWGHPCRAQTCDIQPSTPPSLHLYILAGGCLQGHVFLHTKVARACQAMPHECITLSPG